MFRRVVVYILLIALSAGVIYFFGFQPGEQSGGNFNQYLVILSAMVCGLVLAILINLLAGKSDVEVDELFAGYDQDKSEEKFSMVFKASPESIMITRLEDGKIINVNEAFTRITGYSASEAVNRTTLELNIWVKPEEREFVLRLLKDHSSVREHEVNFRMKNGDIRLFLFSIEKINFGGVPHILTITKDITEAKQAEIKFRQSEHELRSILNNMMDTFYRVDMEGRLQIVSRSGLELLGYTSEEVVGTRMADLYVDQVERENFLHQLKSNGGRVMGYEAQLRRKDGRAIWVSTTAYYSYDADGNIIGIEGVTRDITEKRIASDQLQQARDELEQRVSERTRELEEAKEASERANNAKSDFLSRMSHELRTPLNAILGFGQVLESEELENSQQTSVNEILVAGRHLLSLINEVLDLAKIESGQIDLDIKAVNVEETYNDCFTLLEVMAEEREIAITYDHSACAAADVRADPVRLREVLLNLMSNAIKYNNKGGMLTVACAVSDTGMTRIEVTDTGNGISFVKQQELFDPFNRLGAENSEIEGTGIGLVITKELVELMGGHIGLESTPGSGATFWVELPTMHPVISEDNVTEIQASARESDGQLSGVKSIVYVEDNPANLRLVAKLLSRYPDYHLLTAHTPELGLELIIEHKPDLVLLDINMPGMSGYDVLREIRNNEKTRDIPAIAVTANATDDSIEEGKSAGFNGYLTKPIEIERFYETIKKVLMEEEKQQQTL